MISMDLKRAVCGAVVALALGVSGAASAATISMTAYNAAATDLDLSVDVVVDGGVASFNFANNSTGAAAGSSLARIYFEIGLADLGLTNGVVVGGAGTLFDQSYPGPAAPPAGKNVDWAGATAAYGAGASPAHNGVNAGESLLITFDYSGTMQALIAALTDSAGNARIAGHILNCIDGDSCAAQSMQQVPLPAGLPLLLSGLAGLGFMSRRTRRA